MNRWTQALLFILVVLFINGLFEWYDFIAERNHLYGTSHAAE